MILKKKKYLIIITTFVLVSSVYFLKDNFIRRYEWHRAAEAAASMPFQIGLMNVSIIPCFTTGIPPTCNGGLLCFTKDAGTCTLYSDVSGTPSGGMGANALFQKLAIAKAGVAPGGQLIAGGMSPVLMDSGVLGGAAGCYGCGLAVGNKSFFDKAYDFIIATFVEK